MTAVITHPEKVLFPEDGITKGELAAYYEAIAPVMVPHIRARPITMERFPAGIGRKGFIQKDVSKGFPVWLTRVEFSEGSGELSLAGRALRADLVPAYLARLRADPSLRKQQFAQLEVTRTAPAFVEFTLSSGGERPKAK